MAIQTLLISMAYNQFCNLCASNVLSGSLVGV